MHIMGEVPDYNLYGVLLECVVVAIRFPNHAKNVTGYIEYDCDPLTPNMRRVFNAVKIESYNGFDGDENILRVASKSSDGSAWVANSPKPRAKADGDRVLIAFINGSKDRPVIVGVLPHPASTAITRDPPSPIQQRTIRHKGTTVTIDGNGNVTIKLAANTKIRAGDSTDANLEDAALANTLAQFLSDLKTWLDATVVASNHTHPANGQPASSVSGTVSPTALAFGAGSPSPTVPTITSSKVKVAK